MAYQVFAKAQAQQRTASATSPPLSPPSLQSSLTKQPPLHPPLLVLPQSTISSLSQKSGDLRFEPEPFPRPLTSYQTPHPHISIDPIRTVHIPSLSRITGLLLPIRYPSSFYTACITDPVIASLSRVAVYHDHPVASGPSTETTFGTEQAPAVARQGLGGTDKVIGGIRCRLEKLFPEFAGSNTADCKPPTNLYIQTLHLLSPHRGNGVAASLLNSLLFSKPPSSGSSKSYRVSPLVRHYNIHIVTAHVHETNDEGLRWYVARGFHIEEGVVKGYYRRLNPGGARIVRLDLQWDDQDDIDDQEEEDKEVKQQEGVEKQSDLAKTGPEEDKKTEDDEDEDDDWEKLEAEEDDADDHGVVHLTDSRILDSEDDGSPPTTTNSGKRKRIDKQFYKRCK